MPKDFGLSISDWLVFEISHPAKLINAAEANPKSKSMTTGEMDAMRVKTLILRHKQSKTTSAAECFISENILTPDV